MPWITAYGFSSLYLVGQRRVCACAEHDLPLYLIFSRLAAAMAMSALVESPSLVDNPGDNHHIVWDHHDECDCENQRMP